jgi:hypothetical protein
MTRAKAETMPHSGQRQAWPVKVAGVGAKNAKDFSLQAMAVTASVRLEGHTTEVRVALMHFCGEMMSLAIKTAGDGARNVRGYSFRAILIKVTAQRRGHMTAGRVGTT